MHTSAWEARGLAPYLVVVRVGQQPPRARGRVVHSERGAVLARAYGIRYSSAGPPPASPQAYRAALALLDERPPPRLGLQRRRVVRVGVASSDRWLPRPRSKPRSRPLHARARRQKLLLLLLLVLQRACSTQSNSGGVGWSLSRTDRHRRRRCRCRRGCWDRWECCGPDRANAALCVGAHAARGQQGGTVTLAASRRFILIIVVPVHTTLAADSDLGSGGGTARPRNGRAPAQRRGGGGRR